MRSAIFIFFLTICLGSLEAQVNLDQERAKAIADGKQLFLRELASWQAMDHFRERLDTSDAESAMVLAEGDSLCAFFYRHDDAGQHVVEMAYWMDAEASPGSGREEVLSRSPTHNESRIIRLRDSLAADWERHLGTEYTFHEGTRLSIVVLPGERFHQAYIMTLPLENGAILLGNDYHIILEGNGKVIHRQRLHQKLHSLDMAGDVEVTAHLHAPGEPELLTATDLCTLMLYGQFAAWKEHLAVGPNQVSSWDLAGRNMQVQTRKSWDKQHK